MATSIATGRTVRPAPKGVPIPLSPIAPHETVGLPGLLVGFHRARRWLVARGGRRDAAVPHRFTLADKSAPNGPEGTSKAHAALKTRLTFSRRPICTL